ncbi:MAG TPA: ion channel [Candidatus Bathyarchaeia archaeon]|nr:ion channel [Candidatus Bathyarchaeia archaeon]
MSAAPRRKHLILLTFLILHSIGHPLIEDVSLRTRLVSDAVLVAICFYVLYVVFGERRQRLIGAALLIPVLVANFAYYAIGPSFQRTASILLHCFLIAFLGFAVITILRDLFHKTVIQGDDVIGAICGYILGAMVWANLYALAYIFVPSAFTVNPAITVQLDDWIRKRALFDYLSFTTLTSLGYGDITPVGQPVFSLTWLEVLFGQFYMAVVVAQMVGLKLAQAVKGGDRGPT